MPRGPSGQVRPADTIGCAVNVAQIATGEVEETMLKEPARRKSGIAGSFARAKQLSPEGRSEIAKIAASARWKQ